jgi:hypothetical protein
MSNSQEPGRKPHWTVLSVVMFVLGLLILIPSGLCTGLFGLPLLFGPSGDLTGLPLVLIYGGIPMALGASLIVAGLKARRRN